MPEDENISQCTTPRLCLTEFEKENCESTWSFNKDISSMMRIRLKDMEAIARDFIDHLECTEIVEWTQAHHEQLEVIEQAKIWLRHIEDARMRYWKVIQYSWDWVSVYDKK